MTEHMNTKKEMRMKALKTAFPKTLPVFAGYWFLGTAYGILMRVSGFPFYYPIITNFLVFGGSLEFLIVTMLLQPFAPMQTFIMAFMVQARHLFYGIAMLDKYKEKGIGLKKHYLTFALSDETFSIVCSTDIPEDVDKGWFYFFVSCLDQSYWILGGLTGAFLGNLIHFNTEGLDFVMTAMFVVIMLEQWLKEEKHYTALIGLAGSVVCLLIFGPSSFLIPTMCVILAGLTFFRKPIEKAGGLS